jgi:Kef-type K+ transport system membrane component KefB/voltage-gated potassium channel Kch
MRRAVFAFGGAQVAATALVLGAAARALGATPAAAVTIGLALAMSSTAFAMQILGEKGELGLPHGRAAFGILLFQDVAAMPVLAVLPLLGSAEIHHERGALAQLALVAGILGAVVVAGRWLLRPAFRFVAQARSQELSTAPALLVVLGTATAVSAAGLSMALGAFIAGVLLSDSEYRHELEADIEPFKGLLLGLFFMAVGMSANLRVVIARPLVVVSLVLLLVASKFAILFALGRASKLSARSSIALGAAISQGGEFAFVIFAVAATAKVLDKDTVEMLVVVVTLSLALTPALFRARDAIVKRIAPRDEARDYDEIGDDGSHVIIAGFGRFGQIVGRVLRLKRIAFTALDANPTHVDFLRRYGNRIYYGDAARVDLLRAARADRARVFVLAIDDFEASMRALKVVQEHFPHLHIVARARNRQHAYALIGAGVDHVIRETFAGSVEAARLTLEALGTSSREAGRVVERFASYDEVAVRKNAALRDDEKALIESAKKYAAELERILREDELSQEEL